MHRQDGQILPGLVILMIAVLALGILAFGVGRAAVLRSDAQTAADAAALAGAEDVRRQLLEQLSAVGNTDLSRLDRTAVGRAAEQYAAKNGAELRRPVTLESGDVRVWVRTKGDAGDAAETAGEARARARVEVDPLAAAAGVPGGGGGGPGGSWKGISDAEWKKFAKEVGKPPKCSTDAEDNDVTTLGKFLQSKGIVVIESKQMGDEPRPGVHSATGRHYQCDNSGALDINAGGATMSAMDSIRPKLAELGFFTIWREKDHFDHMHVDAGAGPGGVGTGGGSFGDAELDVKLVDWDAPTAPDIGSLFAGGGGAGANPFGPPDPKVAAQLCRAIEETGATGRARLALWMAAIVESGVHDLPGGDSTSVGVLQALDIHKIDRRDSLLVAKIFLTRGWTTKGGAIAIAKQNPGRSAGTIAQDVQGSDFPDRYDERRLQALAMDRRFCR